MSWVFRNGYSDRNLSIKKTLKLIRALLIFFGVLSYN